MATLLHDILDARAARTPDRAALRRRGETWSYRHLRDRSVAYASWLHAQGVRRGDRVLICSAHSPHAVALVYASSRLGAGYVVVGDRVPPRRLVQYVLDCEPVAALTERRGSTPTAGLEGVPEWSFADLPAEPVGPVPACPAIPIDPVGLIYTSGSTALPKAVVSTHAQVLFAADAIQRRLGYRADDVVFCCLPLSFDYGLYQVYLCCLAGAELVLADGDDAGPALLLRLRQDGVTVLPLVPPLATTLVLLLARSGEPPTSLRMVTSSGARLAATVAQQLRDLAPGLDVVSMFGLTECKRVAISDPNDDIARPGTCGRALPGTEFFVVDDDGNRLPPGEVGELVVRGQHVMAGYWRAPELTARKFHPDEFGQPQLFTGDHCRVDADGHLYFVGRRDDIYKQSGYRVSAGEVEAAAQDLPGVDLAAVLAPTGDRGAVLVISGTATPQDVLMKLNARLESFKVPSECHVFDTMPVGANGKVDKRRLLQTLPPPVRQRMAP